MSDDVVDVTGSVPGPVIALHAIGLEVSAVEHDTLGLLQILTVELPAGGHCNVIYPLERAEAFATAIVDGAVIARENAQLERLERVRGALWVPDS